MASGTARKLLIDTDTASDDAVALIMALRAPEVSVLAITVVAGNVSAAQGTENALFTVELCGSQVPVYTGAAAPLSRPHEDAQWFHGQDGLGDHGYRPATRAAEAESAVDAMVRIIAANPGIELITLGPLTNLALVLQQAPGLAANVSRCVVMGGAPCCEGNVTPAAEFNIWVDPEAARIVFRSGLPIEMIGWQLCRGPAAVDLSDIDRLNKLGTAFADFAVRCNSVAMEAYREQPGEIGISLPDPVAMSILLDQSLCLDSSQHYVEIATGSDLTRGMTVVDRLNVAGNPRNRDVWSDALKHDARATICWQLDIPRWKALLFDA